MIARMFTVLVLIVAIGAVSWGMRAEAQNQTLEDRVAALEEITAAHNMQLTELFSRSLPFAPPNEYETMGFFTLDPAYSFELSCNINTYPMGTQYRLQCMRFLP